MEQTLLDCFKTYYGHSQTGERRATTINEAFALLKNEQWSTKLTVELLRQVTQLKRQHRLNEEILATFTSKIGARVRQAIERIKAFLPRTDKSEFGLEAHLALKKIESELDLIENSP